MVQPVRSGGISAGIRVQQEYVWNANTLLTVYYFIIGLRQFRSHFSYLIAINLTIVQKIHSVEGALNHLAFKVAQSWIHHQKERKQRSGIAQCAVLVWKHCQD